MNIIHRVQKLLGACDLPVLTPMPPHVDAVVLDRELLLIHFDRARYPNPNVVTGYVPSVGKRS